MPRTVESVERLAEALRDGASEVRCAAARALSDIPDARAAEALLQATEDDDAVVRFWAACGLHRHAERVIERIVVVRPGIAPVLPELAKQAQPALAGGAGVPVDTPAEAARKARQIRDRLARTGRQFSDSTELIREDRDR
jgi:HEAT repeat protein